MTPDPGRGTFSSPAASLSSHNQVPRSKICYFIILVVAVGVDAPQTGANHAPLLCRMQRMESICQSLGVVAVIFAPFFTFRAAVFVY